MTTPASRHTTSTHLAFRTLFIVLVTVFAMLTWLIVASLFGLNTVDRVAGVSTLILLVAVAFIFMMALFAVALVVDGHQSDHIVLIVLMSLAPFVAGISLFTLLAALLSALALVFWRTGMLSERNARLEFSFRRIIQSSVGITLTLYFAAVTVTSIASVQPLQGTNQIVDGIANSGTRLITLIAPRFLPGFVPERTVKNYLADQVREQPIAPEQIDEAVAESQAELEKSLKIDITGDETLEDVSELAIRQHVEPAVERYSHFLAPVIAVSLFLALKLVQPILWWTILLFAEIIFKLFWHLKVVRVVRETREVEHLVNL